MRKNIEGWIFIITTLAIIYFPLFLMDKIKAFDDPADFYFMGFSTCGIVGIGLWFFKEEIIK
jgi:hypothetical protein